MENNITLLASSLLGIIVGATLQFIYSRTSEIKKQQNQSRNQAYNDYLKCASNLAAAIKFNNDTKRKELLSITADAKTRVCLYGSKKVIKYMSAFEYSGARIVSKQDADRFGLIVNAMREDTLGKGQKVLPENLFIILFGINKFE